MIFPGSIHPVSFIAHDQDYSQRCLVIVHPRPDCGTNWLLGTNKVAQHSFNIVPFDGYCMILLWTKGLHGLLSLLSLFTQSPMLSRHISTSCQKLQASTLPLGLMSLIRMLSQNVLQCVNVGIAMSETIPLISSFLWVVFQPSILWVVYYCYTHITIKNQKHQLKPQNPSTQAEPFNCHAWSSVSSSLRLKSSFLRTMACRPSPSISKSVELLNTSRLHPGQG